MECLLSTGLARLVYSKKTAKKITKLVSSGPMSCSPFGWLGFVRLDNTSLYVLMRPNQIQSDQMDSTGRSE